MLYTIQILQKFAVYAVSIAPFMALFENSYTYIHTTKKRRPRYCSSTRKGLRTYPIPSTNNNETYADMTNPRTSTKYKLGHRYVIPVGVIAYFVSD